MAVCGDLPHATVYGGEWNRDESREDPSAEKGKNAYPVSDLRHRFYILDGWYIPQFHHFRAERRLLVSLCTLRVLSATCGLPQATMAVGSGDDPHTGLSDGVASGIPQYHYG